MKSTESWAKRNLAHTVPIVIPNGTYFSRYLIPLKERGMPARISLPVF
ncbi:MAG: hypothetical protein QW212_07305 [Nitrososphaerales archaeon]